MKRRKKNRNVETFDVYPHLPQYQYNTGLPTAKKGGDFFTYDDYLTSTVLAQTGIETDEYVTQTPTHKIKGNELKDGYADYGVPEWMKSSPLAAVLGFAGDVKNYAGNLKDGLANINPATGRPYSKLDFAKTTITNTTDENAVIDGEALANSFDWKGDIKKGKNNADNLLMTQNDAQSRYFNKLSDYHSNTFKNEDGTAVASRQMMDVDGNISYAPVTEDNPAFNPMLPEGPDNLKTITRVHNENDLTSFDKAQDNLKDYGVDRIKTDGNGNVTTFSRHGPKLDEIYDPNKPYNDQVIIHENNIQDDLNIPVERFGGSQDLRRFTHNQYQEGGEEGPQPVELVSPNADYFKAQQEELGYLPWEEGYTEANDVNNYEQGINVNEVVPEPEFPGLLPEVNVNSVRAQTPTGGADAEVDNMLASGPIDNTTPLGTTTNNQSIDTPVNNDEVIDMDYGDGFAGMYRRGNATMNTGLVGKAKNVFVDTSKLFTQGADALDVLEKDQKMTNDKIITDQKTDEAMNVNPTVEASRGDRGDFDLNTGDYRVSSLGYGDGPRGQIAQMGQEMGAPNPDYSYLQQFLNSAVVAYEPEMLMMQAKHGSEIIDADMDLIKQLMAAGADFEMI